MKSRAILLAALLAVVAAIPTQAQQAQTGALRVSVKSKMSDQPLQGAQVALQGTRLGGITNEQGLFLLPNVPVGSYTVVVTFLGFSDVRDRDVVIRAGQTTPMDLSLDEAVLSLQEVRVSATTDPVAGIKVPFTVSKVTSEQLAVPTTGTALAGLAGKVAGASIIRSSGKPGSGVSIMLRSPTAFEGSNSPLFVVDGVVIARDLNGTTGDIESLDIENIEIIKGAAAASLYGSRAAAGVVSITTRRGRDIPQNTTRITSRSEFGKDFLASTVPIINAHHYQMNAAGTGLVNGEGRDTIWSGRTPRSYADHGGNARMMDQAFPFKTYDNLRALYNPGEYMSQQFSLSQNTENTTFLVGISRLDQAGALEGNDGYWRNVGRFSIDHRVGTKVSFSITGNHSRTRDDNLASKDRDDNETNRDGNNISATANPYTAILIYPPVVDLRKKDANGNFLQQPDALVEQENPLWRQNSGRDWFDMRARTQGSLAVRYSPLTWMSLDAQLSYDRADTKEQEYTPKGVALSILTDRPALGYLWLRHQENNAYNGALGTTLSRQFGDLNARLALRGTFEREWRERFEAYGKEFIADGIRDLSNARIVQDVASLTSDTRSNGMYADLALDFKDRYIGSFLIRRDGSSRFGPLERWQTYKRASAAYIISREDWFTLPGINELKLRYAMGEAGGQPDFSDQYEVWSISRTSGLSRSNAGNPTLKPQFTREHDFGIDMLALNNRLQLELVYARQLTRDQIIFVPAPVLTGYNSLLANAAVLKGRTYELTATVVPINNRNMRWSINAIADNTETTLVEWNRSCFWGSNASRGHERTCAGEKAGDFWLQRTARGKNELPSWLADRADEFDVNDEGYLVWVGKKADGTPNTWRDGVTISNNPDACAGSRAIAAVAGGCGWGASFAANGFTYRWGEPFRAWNEEREEVQRVNLGSSLPDLGFGFGSNLRYKGFTTYLGFRGQMGGKIYNDARQYLYNQLRHGDLDQTGKPDELKKPIDYYQRGLYNSDNWTDVFLEDGTYLKLQEARVAYRFRRDQMSRILGGMSPSELQLGANARNLFTLTNYSGFDPASAGNPLSRVDRITYPHTRTLTMTVDITF